MAFPQELANTQDIAAQQTAWDATLRDNFDKLASFLKSFKTFLRVDGDTATPSEVEIQLQDTRAADISRTTYLRVRICDQDGFANATNATIAALGGTSVVETLSAGKDLVFKSDGTGLFEIQVTDATAEIVTLRMGPPPLSAEPASYRNTLDIDHTT